MILSYLITAVSEINLLFILSIFSFCLYPYALLRFWNNRQEARVDGSGVAVSAITNEFSGGDAGEKRPATAGEEGAINFTKEVEEQCNSNQQLCPTWKAHKHQRHLLRFYLASEQIKENVKSLYSLSHLSLHFWFLPNIQTCDATQIEKRVWLLRSNQFNHPWLYHLVREPTFWNDLYIVIDIIVLD